MKACRSAEAPDRGKLCRAVLMSALLVCIAACETRGPDLASGEPTGGPFAPMAIDPDAEAVDGMIVGNRLMQAREYELALRAFYRAGAERGMTAEVLSGIGSANLKLGRLSQAETLLRQAVAEDPSYVPGWNNLGALLMEQGEYGEASRVFQKAFALDSGNSDDIRNNLSLALEKRDAIRYPDLSENNEFDLVWQGNGSYALVAP